MDKKKILKIKSDRKTVLVSIRISQKHSNWLREKKYSPTGIFREACKDLGYE